MLQIEKPQLISVGEDTPAFTSLSRGIDVAVGFLRRRYFTILFCLVLSMLAGGLYLVVAPPSYTASAVMMLETRKAPLFQVLVDGQPDPAWLESQISVLKSGNVAAYVIKQLRLAEDPRFIEDSVLDRLLRRLSSPQLPKSDEERMADALNAFAKQLQVRRVGPSYLVQIEFRSRDPEQAIKIANSMVDAYIYDQLNAKYEASQRTGDWLQERLQTLREQASTAERAVVEFKAKNNMVAAGGSLMSDRQLVDLNTQLVAARAHTADVQARLDRMDTILRSDQSAVDESVSEAQNNPIITRLRNQYLDLVNREADWSTRYGKNHVAVMNLRKQMQEARNSILDEVRRIRETAKSDLEIAKQRQRELENRLAGLVSHSQDTNQAQVTLFSLEATAQSYRKMYDSFLQRHTELTQQQSFPMIEARPVSTAGVQKTHPKPLMISLVSIFAGGVLGVGLGALREMRDRGFRTRDQVQSVLQTGCIALVPAFPDADAKKSSRKQGAIAVQSRTAMPRISNDSGVLERRIHSAKVLQRVIDTPSSPYSEAMQSIKLTLDFSHEAASSKIIGLTSCMPEEGKSTIAASLAALIAKSGARVLLVDCDLRNPSLSRALAPDARCGFVDALLGDVPVAEAVWTDPTTHMEFLPAAVNALMPDPVELLTSNAAKALFVTLQVKYDYV